MSLSHTLWTQIRLLLQEQSDLGKHCLPLHIHLSIILANKCSRLLKQISFSGTLRIKVKQYVSFWTIAHLCHGPIHKILLGRVLTTFFVIKISNRGQYRPLSRSNWTHGDHLILKVVRTRVSLEILYIATCDVPVG